jgi:hypothetical protein
MSSGFGIRSATGGNNVTALGQFESRWRQLPRVVVPPAELDGGFPENAVALALAADSLVLHSGVLEEPGQHRRQELQRFFVFKSFRMQRAAGYAG